MEIINELIKASNLNFESEYEMVDDEFTDYLLHEDKLYKVENYINDSTGCSSCDKEIECTDLILVNHVKQMYVLFCFKDFKFTAIEDQKKILELLLSKDYFEFDKICYE